MNTVGKIILAIGAGIALLGAGAFGGANMFPKEVIKEVPVEKNVTITKTVEIPVEVEVIKEVPKEVPVEVVKEVDNGNLATFEEYVQDNYEEDLTVDYVVFEIDAKNLAESYINSNIIALLKDNDFFDDDYALEDYRSSEVSIKKISDPVVSDVDFEDKDVTLDYQVTLRAQENGKDKEYFIFNVSVPFEKGQMQSEDISIEED